MAWNDTLKFDIDKLKQTQTKCNELKDELSSDKDKLMDLLNGLRKDWQTDAGKKFFNEQNTDWESQVDNYAKIIGAISELLTVAINQYQIVIDEAKKLSV